MIDPPPERVKEIARKLADAGAESLSDDELQLLVYALQDAGVARFGPYWYE